MKRPYFFNSLPLAALCLGLLLPGPRAALAQASAPMGGASTMNAAMLKLLGSNTVFTAKADVRVTGKTKQPTDLPVTFALLDGKTRMEVDLNQVKSDASMPALIPTLRKLGMDQMVVISRPDKKFTLDIYPHAAAYAEIAMSKDEEAAADRHFQVVKTPLGKETIDGHACQKSKVTLTDDKARDVDRRGLERDRPQGFSHPDADGRPGRDRAAEVQGREARAARRQIV